jgi:hypothetical protein
MLLEFLDFQVKILQSEVPAEIYSLSGLKEIDVSDSVGTG